MPADSPHRVEQDGAALCLMAKAPVAGQVKTRMQPQLSAEQSAQLAQLMLQQSVRTACRHWPGEVLLCASPHASHPAFARLADCYSLTVVAQIEGDLGARMTRALGQGIARAGRAAVMGCDVPHCSGAILAAAHAMLLGGENPLGPAADGGFYLLGLQRVDDALLSGIDWRAAPLSEVRQRAAAAGLRLADLPTLRDIDQYPDLEWLAGMDPAYRRLVASAN